jgi:hypothetical protein
MEIKGAHGVLPPPILPRRTQEHLIPVKRQFGGRWFDDFTVPRQMIRECLATQKESLRH